MVFGAYLAGRGRLSLEMVYVSTTLGGACGFMLLYYLGTLFRRRSDRRGKFLGIGMDKIGRVEARFRLWGWWLIFFNRFFYGVRIVIALFAGMSRLSWWKTAIIAVGATALWNGILIYLGNLLGENWGGFKQLLWKYQRWIWAVVIAAAVVIIVNKVLTSERKKREK